MRVRDDRNAFAVHRPHLDYTKPGPNRRTRIDCQWHLAGVRAVRLQTRRTGPQVTSSKVRLHGSYAILPRKIVNTPCTPPTSVGAGSDRTSRHRQRQPRRLCCRRLPALARGDSLGLGYARRSLFKDAWPRSMAARGTAFVSAPGVRAYISPAARGTAFVSVPGVRGRKGEIRSLQVTPAIVYSMFSPSNLRGG